MTPWGRTRSLLLCVVSIVGLALGPGVSGAPVSAQSAIDLRGTWTVRFDDTTGASTVRLVIKTQGDDGTISGRYLAGDTVWRLTGKVKGEDITFTTERVDPPGRGRYRFEGTLHDTAGRLEIRGTAHNLVVSDPPDRFIARQRVERSLQGGTRPSATMVICDRDMTVNTDDAVLECTTQVTDASGQPGSRAPTGAVTWTTEVGTISPETCVLHGGGGSTAWRAVALRARAGKIPIGTAPPVTAAYAGDALFAPSEGSPALYGAASTYAESDQYGPACNPASGPYPSASCGDPINPATGNLSMLVADIGISGRGPALAVVRTYNAQVAASGATGRFGAGWSDEHEAHLVRDGKHVTVHLGTGATVRFTAKGKGFTAPGWVTATLARLKDKSYRLTLGDQTWFAFDARGALTAFGDRTNEPISITRDASGSITAASDAAGRSLTFTSDAAGRVTGVTDPVGRTVKYAYDAAGDLVAVTDVLGGITSYTYDERHRMTSSTDARGSTATTVYDDHDRVTSQVDPLGNVMTLAYSGTYPALVTVLTDGVGTRTALEYRNGMLVAGTEGLGTHDVAHTSYLYDAAMRHIGTIDPRGGLWRLTRDEAGNVLTATDPLDRVTTMTWDDRRDPLSVTTPMGIRTVMEYDDLGLVARVIVAAGTPDEAVTTISRDDPAHPSDVSGITDAAGSETRFGYNAAGDVVRVTDALGQAATIERDALGWETALTDPLGHRTTITRDGRGQVTSVRDPLGGVTSSTWDPVGALASVTDAVGATTVMTHDGAGRTAAAHLPDGTRSGVTRDPLGDITSQIDASGAVSTSAHDALRRVISFADPLGHTSSATYSAAGDVLSTTNALDQTTHYTWDTAGQLTAISYDDDTPDVTFSYDADGRRTSMTDGTGTTRYQYDARDRLVSTTDAAGATVRATWDLRSDMTGLVYPDGLTVAYDRDALGRLVGVRDSLGHTSTFGYDAAGRLVSSTLGNGATSTRTYDANDSLLSITDGAASASYTRDAMGRVASIAEAGAPTLHASHDVRGRLTGLGGETFAFDLTGALTSLRGASLSYDAAGRLQRATLDGSTTTYAFDDAGRRVSRSGPSPQTYDYDAAGRLTAVGSDSWTYSGDGLRRSVADAVGRGTRFSWLSGAGLPVLLTDGTARYVYGPAGMPIAQVASDGTTLWLHTDQTGSVRALTDDQGAVVATFAFDAYGQRTAHTGSADTRLGFQGSYTDLGSGLQYLLARVYDPTTGQFLTVDPAVMQTQRAYAFAAGDPLSYGDRTGLDVALAGHGHWEYSDGFTTVPEGTTLVFHTPAGWGMEDGLGTHVEGGGHGQFEERFGPGSRVPNYILGPPTGLNVLRTSTTVSSATPLGELLKPYQGSVHWAACRSYVKGNDDYKTTDPGSPRYNASVNEHVRRAVNSTNDYGWEIDSTAMFGDNPNGFQDPRRHWQRRQFVDPSGPLAEA